MPPSILVLIVFALAVLSERKQITKQTGGADKAIVALLFAVIGAGGFTVAYALNDDVKNWANGLFEDDDHGDPKSSPCATHTSSPECPTPRCKWDAGKCKKDTGESNNDNRSRLNREIKYPENKCSPPYMMFNKLLDKRNECQKGIPTYLFGENLSETYNIECKNGVSTITSLSVPEKEETVSEGDTGALARALRRSGCKNVGRNRKWDPSGLTKIPWSQNTFYYWRIKPKETGADSRDYYVFVLSCNKKEPWILAVGGLPNGSQRPHNYAKFRFMPVEEPIKSDLNGYLLTNTEYKVSLDYPVLGQENMNPYTTHTHILVPSRTHVASGAVSHTNIVATTNTKLETSENFFHVIFIKQNGGDTTPEPLNFADDVKVHYISRDNGSTSTRGGEMKMYWNKAAKAMCGNNTVSMAPPPNESAGTPRPEELVASTGKEDKRYYTMRLEQVSHHTP